MRVVVLPSSEAVAERGGAIIAQAVRANPACVLGLATGSTPLGAYKDLVRRHEREGLDFSKVTTFNLDEYVGLGPKHPQSYRYFMQQNLFDQINVDPLRTHVPDGRALDFDAYCKKYEQQIADAGGIDLQLLGIGADGHIAFNEPGSSLGSRTRLKTLTSETVEDNARFFENRDEVPRLAVTMGVGTILESKKCLLLAIGEHKAGAIRSMIEGPITSQVTASALQLHQDVTVVVDETAASWLERRAYYDEVEQAQALIESGQPRALGIQSPEE